jgi:hypothetical protein
MAGHYGPGFGRPIFGLQDHNMDHAVTMSTCPFEARNPFRADACILRFPERMVFRSVDYSIIVTLDLIVPQRNDDSLAIFAYRRAMEVATRTGGTKVLETS